MGPISAMASSPPPALSSAYDEAFERPLESGPSDRLHAYQLAQVWLYEAVAFNLRVNMYLTRSISAAGVPVGDDSGPYAFLALESFLYSYAFSKAAGIPTPFASVGEIERRLAADLERHPEVRRAAARELQVMTELRTARIHASVANAASDLRYQRALDAFNETFRRTGARPASDLNPGMTSGVRRRVPHREGPVMIVRAQLAERAAQQTAAFHASRGQTARAWLGRLGKGLLLTTLGLEAGVSFYLGSSGLLFNTSGDGVSAAGLLERLDHVLAQVRAELSGQGFLLPPSLEFSLPE